jgi:outer membrane protein assembly factor BamB
VAAAAGLTVAGWELAGPGHGGGSGPVQQARGPGSLLWSHQTGGPVSSGAALAGRAVYIGCDDGHVYALAAASGRRIRTFALGSAVTAAVTVARGALFAATARGTVHALPLTAGGPRWTYRTGGHPVAGRPAVAGGVVYVGDDNDSDYALAADSKQLRWTYQTGGPVRPGPMPGRNPFDNKVYAGSDDGHVYAFDTQSGEVQWKYALRGRVSSGLAQATPARVYAGDEHGNLYGLDALTGAGPASNWRVPLGGAIDGALLAEQDTVYAGTADGAVHAVNIEGTPLWSYRAGAPVNSGLAIRGGTLYAGSDDGYLHAIDVSTGKPRWRYQAGGPVRSQILVAGRVVYFGSLDHQVYAVRA